MLRIKTRRSSSLLASLWVLQAALFALSWKRFMALPGLPTDNIEADTLESESFAIVIPARNEAYRLPDLLQSLRGVEVELGRRGASAASANLTAPLISVLVIDDDSMDQTGELVEAFGFRVLRSTGPPTGWTGKNWSCWQGARATESDWILFVDADVTLESLVVRAAANHARRSGAALLSLFLQQRCETFWERLILPYAFSLYFTGGGGKRVNSVAGRGLANGQFILVRRDEYFAVGGHQAIAGSVIDDVALARLFLAAGRTVLAMRAESMGSVRMYTGLSSIRAGFSKNVVQFSGATRGAWMAVVTSCLSASLAWRFLRSLSPAQGVGVVMSSGVLMRWYRSFGAPRWYAFGHPLAALVFQLIAIEATVRERLGLLQWSGRRLR